jgi:hypothetical protein
MKSALVSMALLLSPLFVHSDPEWVSVPSEVPANAVAAGTEANVPNYVCRSEYQGGVHPGKYFAGKCNIEFAGQEVVQETFEVLVADSGYFLWVPDSNGEVPVSGFQVGSENGTTLYSCRAEVYFPDSITDVGTHAGKLVADACNIPYGGVAYHSKQYQVLSTAPDTTTVRLAPRWNRAGARRRIPLADDYGADGRAVVALPGAERPVSGRVRLTRP